jgi:hypothetical protein
VSGARDILDHGRDLAEVGWILRSRDNVTERERGGDLGEGEKPRLVEGHQLLSPA